MKANFTSPDPLPASGRALRPQSWNRYAYALNNPLRFNDPTGLAESQATCKQEPDGQQKQVNVPASVQGGAAKNWQIDEERDGELDGEIEFQKSEADVLAGLATVNYQAQFIETTDELNANEHGVVSQTTVQQDTSSSNSTGASSQQSVSVTGEASAQPRLSGTLGTTEGRTVGGINSGGMNVSQTLDPAARCNAMALDKDATIKTNNAINALEGKTVNVYRGEIASPLKLTRPMATTIVRGVVNYARERARTDAIMAYPAPLKK